MNADSEADSEADSGHPGWLSRNVTSSVIEALRSGARTVIIANKALSSQTTTLSVLSSALRGIKGWNTRCNYSMLPIEIPIVTAIIMSY
ncbi:hypothetical protein N7527_011829 [Penicillium freii]|nr:hypothetical protein N7527_011829 [Penicillium freii]